MAKVARHQDAQISAELEQRRRNLVERRTNLVERRTSAELRRSSARGARADLLRAGGDIDQHNSTMRQASEEIMSIDEVLTEVDNQIAAADVRLAAAREHAAREHVAGQLEALIPAAVIAAGELDKAMLQVADAYERLVSALPELKDLTQLDRKPTGRETVATAALVEAIRAALPGVLGLRYQEGGYHQSLERSFRAPAGLASKLHVPVKSPEFEAASATLFAKTFVTDLLSKRAAEVRSGKMPAAIKSSEMVRPPAQRPPAPLAPASVDIVARENFVVEPVAGKMEEVPFGKVRALPSVLTGMLMAQGLAFRADTAEGMDFIEKLRKGAATAPKQYGNKYVVGLDSAGNATINVTGPGRGRAPTVTTPDDAAPTVAVVQ